MHWNDQLWKCIDSAAEELRGLVRSSKGIASMRIATELGSQDVHGNSKEWNRDGMAKSRAALAKLGCE